jgi:mannose-6-phosphate isomerase-like protein (cupin superfamily)
VVISKYLPDTEFLTPERCHIVEIHNCSDDQSCSIVRARVMRGVTTQLHALQGIAERYVIIEGEGSVEIGGGSPSLVKPLDIVSIDAGAAQRITNTGNTDLVFLCICTPRFDRSSYMNLEA